MKSSTGSESCPEELNGWPAAREAGWPGGRIASIDAPYGAFTERDAYRVAEDTMLKRAAAAFT